MSTKQTLQIGDIELTWSEWYPWEALKTSSRNPGGISIPKRKPGVYEVRRVTEVTRLTIGKISNLRFRVRQALVKEGGRHSAGRKIRASEDLSQLYVRWAETSHPAAAEEELHRLYYLEHNKNPEYTLNAEYKPARGKAGRSAADKTQTPYSPCPFCRKPYIGPPWGLPQSKIDKRKPMR